MQNRHPNENNWNKWFDNNGNNCTKKMMKTDERECIWECKIEMNTPKWNNISLVAQKNVSFMLSTLNGFLLYVVKLIEISCFPYLCISKIKFITIKLKNVFNEFIQIFAFHHIFPYFHFLDICIPRAYICMSPIEIIAITYIFTLMRKVLISATNIDNIMQIAKQKMQMKI